MALYFLMQDAKRKLFYVFLKQFQIVYKNWEPAYTDQFPEVGPPAASPAEYLERTNDIVVGCTTGHPAEIILTLTEEITHITALVAECKLVFVFYMQGMNIY